MLEAYTVISKESVQAHKAQGGDTLAVTLRFDEREKSRYKTQTHCAQALGWFLERGFVLEHGQGLKAASGELIEVFAAAEKLSQVTSTSAHQLMRGAYHLGNRHVPLQVEAGKLCYLQDYVLDDMVKGLGLTLEVIEAPFTPESGAYHSHSGGHAHSHSHD